MIYEVRFANGFRSIMGSEKDLLNHLKPGWNTVEVWTDNGQWSHTLEIQMKPKANSAAHDFFQGVNSTMEQFKVADVKLKE